MPSDRSKGAAKAVAASSTCPAAWRLLGLVCGALPAGQPAAMVVLFWPSIQWLLLAAPLASALASAERRWELFSVQQTTRTASFTCPAAYSRRRLVSPTAL